MTFRSKTSADLAAGFLACLWAVIIAGCGKTSIVGLYPDNPPVTRTGVSLHTDFVEVDTLKPTFRWHPLVIKTDPQGDQEPVRIDTITYEIRIWRTVSSDTGKLVYQRRQLTTTEHRLEQALDYGTRYYWSVRAHFKIDGKNRTTEWTLAGYPLRSDSVPNDSCLRFKTPDRPDTISRLKKPYQTGSHIGTFRSSIRSADIAQNDDRADTTFNLVDFVLNYDRMVLTAGIFLGFY